MSDGADESASAYTMTVDVTALTDAPTASNNTVTTTEDTAYTFTAADFNFSDADTGDTLSSVKIVTLPALGSLTNGGTAVRADQSIAKADIDANRLVFTPVADGNGDPYTSFTFKVSDGADESASAYTMTVDVTAANAVPMASDSTVTTTEDTAYTFTAADFNFSDADTGDTLSSVKIVTLPALGSLTNGGTAVRADQSIAKADIDANRLVFTPVADGNGDHYTSFTFKVSDGADESASAYTMTVDVTAVTDAPTASDSTVTATEDTAYAFAAADFNFFDADTGDMLSSVKIVTLPALGSLTNDDTAVRADQSIARADIDANRLVFTPAADGNGDPYTSFTFKVSDGADESASAYTMTVGVTAVNDVPTASDSTVAATQDTAYSFAAADFNFASGDTGDTLSSVKIVTLPALGSLTNGGTAVTANQEIAKADIDANRLVFTPAANVHGDSYTSFTFKVSDGTDESASAYTMTVDVTAANDAPTASDNTVTTTEDTAYTLAAADFNFSDTDTGDMLASVKIVTLPGLGALTNDGTAVRANQSIARADIDANKLVFIPVEDAHGDSYTSFTFKVSDGADESASAYTMTVDVTAVTDAPTASDSTVTATEDMAYAFAAADFNFASGDTGDALASVRIVTLPALGSLTNDGTAVTANQEIAKADIDANRLVFTPAANVHGDSYTSFTFKVSDGTDESASAYTMTVDVTAANDAPTASNSTVTATEDTVYAFTAADFNFSDTDTGDMLASVKIVTLPGLGSLTNGGTAVTANQEIATVDIDANRLVFTPAADGNGDPYTSFTFKVSDGTDESASANTMTVRVTAVNDAPTAAHGGVTTLEDTDYAFAAADFNFSDVEVDDTLSSVRIVRLPALGSLANDGTAVTANQTIARADIDSGRLVFSPAANADGDRYARFTFKVSDGDRESASTYTMTINVTATVETGMVQGWNARFGRTIGGQLVDAVTARFEFGGGSQVTLGGERIGGFGPGEPEEAAGFADQLGWMKDAENAAGPRATRGMTGKELLRGSAFHLSGGEAEGDGGYVVWGHVAVGAFEARADDMKMDGDVTTRLLGVDGKWGRVLAGFALARSEGEGSFRQVVLQSDRGGRGTIDSSLSGVYPYARLTFGEGLTAWALAGYGAGSLTLTPKDEEAFRTSLAMQIGTLGVKGLILGGEEMGALRISVKSDAMWVHTASDGARGLNEAEGNARRLRLMLDAERSFGAGEDAAITPSGEIGLRHDGGDAETGAGLELGGGFRYVVGGFTAAGRARLLVSHDAAGHKEWGASGSLALSPDALARGLSYSLRPVWGQADSGTGALWSLDDARDLGTGRAFEAEGRLEARLGYGFAAIGDRFTATPELRLRLAESHRRYSAGWRLEHARRERVDFDLLFEATRRGSDDRQPEYGLGVRGSMRW